MSKRKTGWIPMFSPLAHRGYRHLFIAQVAALLGTGLATIALGLLAHRLAGANAGEVLAMVLSIKMVAYIGVAPFASAIAAHGGALKPVYETLGISRKTLYEKMQKFGLDKKLVAADFSADGEH